MSTRTLLLILFLVAVLVSTVQAQTTITVTTTTDELNTDGDCSLREAIQAANTNAAVSGCPAGGNTGTDIIKLPAGTYTLTLIGTGEGNNATGDLDIKSDLKLEGAGASSTVIDGNQTDRVLSVASQSSVEIRDVTITNGHAPDATSEFQNGEGAGGIFNLGTLTITNATLSGNQAGDGFDGGFGGSGGGILNAGDLTIMNTQISGNQAGGGGFGGPGGGIENANGTLTITNTTISGNQAGSGGGISSDGTLTITNSTINGNQADFTGGGIYLSGSEPSIKSTILANNIASGATGPDCHTSVTNVAVTGDYNLIENTTDCAINGATTNNITGQDPKLGPLQDNGGPTQTHAFLVGSPALDKIPNGTNGCGTAPLNQDQRGFARPQSATARCDMGAFEAQLPPLIPPLIPQPDRAFTTRGDSFGVSINLGEVTSPTTDFFGIGFKLHYDVTRLSFGDTSDVLIGTFFPNATTQRIIDHDSTQGILAVSYVPEGSGSGGVSGHGTVLGILFHVKATATADTVAFSFSDVLLINSQGQEIPVTAQTDSIAIFEAAVWPGNTDPPDCDVDQDDVLPIGIAWGRNGPARGFDLQWEAQGALDWPTTSSGVNDAHVDGTGDGIISQNDLLPIGLNWGLTRFGPGCLTQAAPKHQQFLTLDVPPAEAGTTLPVYLNIDHPVDALLGIAFELTLPPDLFNVNATRAGAFLDDGDLLALDRYDAQTGTLAAAFTRKGTNAPASGTGTLVEIELEVLQTLTASATLTLTSLKLSQPTGSIADPSSIVALSLESSVATATEFGAEVPTAFQLYAAYPNPFNPTTTIGYDLPESGEVTLLVYDVLGREVRRVLIGQQAAGAGHRIAFEAGDLASGLYLYRVVARLADRQEMKTGRFVLMK